MLAFLIEAILTTPPYTVKKNIEISSIQKIVTFPKWCNKPNIIKLKIVPAAQ